MKAWRAGKEGSGLIQWEEDTTQAVILELSFSSNPNICCKTKPPGSDQWRSGTELHLKNLGILKGKLLDFAGIQLLDVWPIITSSTSPPTTCEVAILNGWMFCALLLNQH